MTLLTGFIWGFCGGGFIEIFTLYNYRTLQEKPEYIKTIYYWLWTLVMMLVGGLLVVMYIASGARLNPLLAVNVGASTPLILASLSKATPEIPIGRIDTD